jgi:hypothetical protein
MRVVGNPDLGDLLMPSLLKNVLIVGLCLIVTSCAQRKGPINFEQTYTPPELDRSFTNTVVLNQNFQDTWNQIISNLAKTYFVINNVEKDSRIMNVSFSVTEPQKYVDCGRSKRTVELRSGVTLEKEYEVTKSVTVPLAYPVLYGTPGSGFAAATTIANILWDYGVVEKKRWTALSGRSNIYLAPKGKNQTEVSVNTKFKFGVNDRRIAIVGEHIVAAPFTIGYTTNSPGKAEVPVLVYVDPQNVPEKYESRIIRDGANGAMFTPIYEFIEVRCISKFVVERDILDAAIIK